MFNPMTKKFLWSCTALLVALVVEPCFAGGGGDLVEGQIFQSRPRADREMEAGHIGPTGIIGRFYRGIVLKVEKIEKGTPADGKFKNGDILSGINGQALKDVNPFIVLGNAITAAEAKDGKLVFDVVSDGKEKQVALEIPVFGSYSPTWPANCKKSKKIVEQAAAFYSNKDKHKPGGLAGGLMCIFLLSTGDDRYVPRVRDYFAGAMNDPKVGDQTWDNGYNGIAICEYYLRTGDKTALPLIQAYCDNAKERQVYASAWGHWGRQLNPGYCGAGIMNPASTQILTSLLLAKECGVNVDDTTLMNALRFFYRFAGHGTVPYGDDRGEGGLGANGKDSMLAAAMQIASDAEGDTTIYKNARDYLSMSTITNYPCLVRGHADEGRGDGMWRGVASSYLMEQEADNFRSTQDRLTWWYDLSRSANGGLGIATCQRFNDLGSGAGVALGYTAHLKTLRITGAPKSKHAKAFTLPKRLWGNEADLDFFDIKHNPTYYKYGKDEPTHIPYNLLGSAYSKTSKDPKDMDRAELLKNIYHKRYMIRCQAAKALRRAGHLKDLEQLLTDKDPRVRRAALDGIIDYNYWFSMGRDPLKTEQYTPGMIKAIVGMLRDPDEAWYVVDGALFAMRNAPVQAIQENMDAIMPWTKHKEWWLRESAFMALYGLEKDEEKFVKILPTLMDIIATENHKHPRDNMQHYLKGKMNNRYIKTPGGKLIIGGLLKAAQETRIKQGMRAPEGAYNVCTAVRFCLEKDAETAVEMAKTVKNRFDVLEPAQLVNLIASPNSNRENPQVGFYGLLEKQTQDARQKLTNILYDEYRPEMIKRFDTATGDDRRRVMDTIVDLTRLKNNEAGWQPIGAPALAKREWSYTTVDPQQEKDVMHRREGKRFRDIRLPGSLEGWYNVGFDDSKWEHGNAPIGKGEFSHGKMSFENKSFWGYGEFLLMRTTFDVDKKDYDLYRISVLASQGFHIYLNGHKIHTYVWWKSKPHYRPIVLTEKETQYLKEGKNTLAVYTNTEYPHAMNRNRKCLERGQIDCYIEGLRMKDLGLTAAKTD